MDQGKIKRVMWTCCADNNEDNMQRGTNDDEQCDERKP